MKKDMTICVVVILLVVIGNYITQYNTKKSVEIMNKQLGDLKKEINENTDSIQTKMSETKKKWDELQELLSFYIEHNELEKVETQISVLKGEIESELYEETIPEIEKCIFILEHIQDKTALKVKNIF